MKTRYLLVVLALFATSAFADGAALFKSKCAMCHGPDGSGQTAMGRSMKLQALGSAAVQKQSDAQLFALISDGRGKMPSYKGKLTPDEIRQLVKHIRSFKK